MLAIKEIEKIANDLVKNKKVAGLAIAYTNGFNSNKIIKGHHNITSGTLITDSTLFELASLTKIFTALLFAKLSLSQKINLTEKLENFSINLFGTNVGQVTLQELLSHTSGLTRLPSNLNPNNPENPYVDYTLEDLDSELRSTKTLDRGNYNYSNLGFAVAGRFLEKIDSRTFESLLKEEILCPLNMMNTKINLNKDDQIRGYSNQLKLVTPWELALFEPAIGLKSNINDFVIFLNFLINGSDNSLYNSFLKTIQIVHQDEELAAGLGWHLDVTNDILSHDGATFGSYSKIRVSLRNKRAIAYLSNTYLDPAELDDKFRKYVNALE